MGLGSYSNKLWIVGVVFGACSLFPGAGYAQNIQQVTGRFQVLIPNLEAKEGADDDFGKRVAAELRMLIDDLGTHRSVEDDAFEKARDEFDVDEDELTCALARQLAQQMQVAVVVCGSTVPAAGDEMFEVVSSFVTVENGETFDVPTFTAHGKEPAVAASRIFDVFELAVEQQRRAQFCAEYVMGEQWDSALDNCGRAIELNPAGVSSIYMRGMAYMKLERWDNALQDFERVLELDPIHENGLKAAGFVSAQIGGGDAALGYYQRFLQLSPGDVRVRMNVAYEAATAGEPLGAMVLIDEGLAIEPDNVDLWLQKAGYAMSAAERIFKESGNEVDEESSALYRASIEAYDKVFAARAGEVKVSQRRNVISAYQRLGDLEMAQQAAEEALQTWPDEAQLWSVNADVLQKMGRLEEAIAALDRALESDSTYPNVWVRKGTWLLEADRSDEAATALGEAVSRGGQSGDRVANIFFANGYRQGVQQENWSRAVARFRQAVPHAEGEEVKPKVGFWLGYALLKYGEVLQQPQTLESAQRTRPMFAEALSRLQGSGAYSEIDATQLQNLVKAATQFLEIQDAIIRRGS